MLQVEQTFGAKPLASLAPHLLSQYRECLEACMEEADLEDYFSRGIGVSSSVSCGEPLLFSFVEFRQSAAAIGLFLLPS